jgi:hypothetical protein
MNKNYYLFLLFVFIFSNSFAQSQAERNKITNLYKANEKNQVPFNSEKYSKTEKADAVAKALSMGIPLTITDVDGEQGELVRFDGALPLYYKAYNEGSAITTRTNLLYASAGLGYNLTGAGMLVGVWDQNHPRLTHLDLRQLNGTPRMTAIDGPTPQSNHSTHVTGTIMSNGVNSPSFSGRGMAYESDGWILDWNNDISEMETYADFGLLISNHSYGLIASNLPLWFFGAYVNDSREVDAVCFNRPKYLPVYAAGNDRSSFSTLNPLKAGNDLLTGDKVSKNSLVVGAVSNVAEYIDPSSVMISGFSSYGPTDDFRIKPDIVAKGVNVFSTTSSDDTSYGSQSGTSMAAPGVTGSLLLVQQHFGDPYLNASTLKGLAIHTADEAGPAEGPDHMYGWGLLNTYKMVQTLDLDGTEAIVEERTLTNNNSYIFNVLALGTEPLKVSISWTDRPGNVASSVVDSQTARLVNDLDVVVVKDGVDYSPWRLNKDWNNIVAEKGNNNVDPIERVDIDEPNGIYQIRVTHKGTLVGGAQNYSLIVTGVDADAPLSSTDFAFGEFIYWIDNNQKTLNFQSENSKIENIEIFDLNGRSVLYNSVNDANMINVSDLSKGVYIVKFVNTNGEILTKKVII